MRASSRVVITGLGVVSPIGIGKDAFWQSLIAGKSGVDYITAFDASSYPCQIAAEVKNFTPADFTNARKGRHMARFSQFAIAATRLALDDARLSITAALASDTTIFFGTSVSGGGDIAAEASEALTRDGVSAINPSAALEYPPHASSSYLAIEFGITGPAMSISSNCCTGLDAVHAGFLDIARGQTRVAVVGSADAPIFPLSFGAFCALGALSKRNYAPQAASRPYDALRDGIVIGEGAATLILEDLEFAQDRGANIYAEVLGYGAASEALGMRKGDLSGKVMAGAILEAIKSADLLPSNIDHINAHGSSLPDYDVCDSNAFKHSLGHHAYRIPVTSIKSMIGQPVSAAGAMQTVAACLSLRHQIAPPTINQEVPDQQCDLDYVPNVARVARIKHVLVNGHSFGGSVAALVIGQFPG
jgi:3-oxoacyl-[acyl-carrier-protein] synthase II